MPELSLKLGAQFTAACVAMEGCALLASRLPQHANTTFRLASALALVFGAGPAFLRQCAVPWPGMGLDPAQFLIEANHQLGAAAAVLHCASASWHQPAAAEAFVRTAGRPQAVMPWLLAVSQAVLTLPADMQGTISSIRDGSRTSARGKHPCQLQQHAAQTQQGQASGQLFSLLLPLAWEPLVCM